MNVFQQVRDDLSVRLIRAIERAIQSNELALDPAMVPPVKIEEPRDEAHGDFATNLALVLAGKAGKNPRTLAETITRYLEEGDGVHPFVKIEKVEVAGPGFINFYLSDRWLWQGVSYIAELGDQFGESNYGGGQKVLIEYCSANPTGPIHVGHGRGTITGDVLSRIMEAAGFKVTREYYINDAGRQVELLGESVLSRYLQLFGQDAPLPEGGYHGDYIKEFARKIKERRGDELLDLPDEERLKYCRDFAYEEVMRWIKDDLMALDINFDIWYSEQKLHRENKIKETLERLQERDLLYVEDGATWLRTSEFGDDKDRVLIKSDGSYTYFAADIAYHLDKLQRGYDLLIDVWGADHHGHIPRMKAAIEALNDDPNKLEILIVQIVTLLRGGEEVRMSKRAGEFITLRDIVEEIGKDATRYFYIERSPDSHYDFDLEVAKEESANNPVYYIQYAHARISSMLKKAAEEGIEIDFSLPSGGWQYLTTDDEKKLMWQLGRFPQSVIESASQRAPHVLARYLYELATIFHGFYNRCPVIGEDPKLTRARLFLVLATRQVIRKAAGILGISTPEKM